MAKPKIKIDFAQVEELAAARLTQEQIAGMLGIGERTLYRRKNDMAEMAAALTRGKNRAILKYADKLMQIADNKEKEYDTSSQLKAIMFFLERKGGWVKQDKLALEKKEPEPLKVEFEFIDPKNEA